jgi:hypothetical protein
MVPVDSRGGGGGALSQMQPKARHCLPRLTYILYTVLCTVGTKDPACTKLKLKAALTPLFRVIHSVSVLH